MGDEEGNIKGGRGRKGKRGGAEERKQRWRRKNMSVCKKGFYKNVSDDFLFFLRKV